MRFSRFLVVGLVALLLPGCQYSPILSVDDLDTIGEDF